MVASMVGGKGYGKGTGLIVGLVNAADTAGATAAGFVPIIPWDAILSDAAGPSTPGPLPGPAPGSPPIDPEVLEVEAAAGAAGDDFSDESLDESPSDEEPEEEEEEATMDSLPGRLRYSEAKRNRLGRPIIVRGGRDVMSKGTSKGNKGNDKGKIPVLRGGRRQPKTTGKRSRKRVASTRPTDASGGGRGGKGGGEGGGGFSGSGSGITGITA